VFNWFVLCNLIYEIDDYNIILGESMTEGIGRDFTEAYKLAFKRPHIWTSKWFWLGIIFGLIVGTIIWEAIKILIGW
jgi:hypothetical protein